MKIGSSQIRQKYLKFFSDRGHAVIPSASLVPENDPTTLFTGSGMQPMLPYLLGQDHPLGTKLVDSQKCFRAQDIEEVGDNRHTTFFEMLGNWSLGDYFKKEQQIWIWEFLTKELELDPQKLYVSVFEGNDQVRRDEEASENWKSLGVFPNHIFYYGVNKNWWARSNYADMPIGEPGGPDSEIFYDFGTPHDKKFGDKCHPNCDCGRFMEIANSVFMQYQKQPDGSLSELKQKNVDFGGGLERLAAVANDNPDIFQTDLYISIIQIIEKITGKSYSGEANQSSMRIIADHLKASAFLIADGIYPSNKVQGYIIRRLLRRSAVKLYTLINKTPESKMFSEIAEKVVQIYQDTNYFDPKSDIQKISSIVSEEINKFGKVLSKGIKMIEKAKSVDAKSAFNLYQSYGFPIELTAELLEQKGQKINLDEFKKEFEKHQSISRTASKGMFRGGLADHSEAVTKLHTATHLLHAALRKFVGTHVQQKGSNITAQRLRFDFTHNSKLTEKERSEIEKWINRQIFNDLPVTKDTTTLAQAKENGALAFFGEKYGDKVTVYTIGDEKTGIVSKEVCGGPHVIRTGILGLFKLGKEETVSAGVRRVYAFLTPK